MWQIGTAAILAGTLWLLVRALVPMRRDTLTVIAIGLVWVRFALAALGPAALETQVAGQSLMALGTLAAVGMAALLTPLWLMRSEQATPIWVVAGIGIAGTVLSGSAGALPGYVTLWLLFAVLALLLQRAYRLHGPPPVLRALLAAFSLPLGMQVLSLVARAPKVGPDGSLSYIGAYGHEAVFAIVMLGGTWVAAIYPWRRRGHAWLAIGVGLASLLLANYRTMLVAALPLLVAFALFDTRATRGQILRRLAVICGVALLAAPVVVPQALIERFAELGTLAGNWDLYVKPPEIFTAADKNVLSARIYIWASYAAAVGAADLPQLLLGHGAGTLAPGMSVHPHNEFLRVLYQQGILGAVGLFGLIVVLAVGAARAASRRAGLLTAAGFAGMLAASTGTSLYDRPEGMIVLAILTATAWSLTGSRAPQGSVLRPSG